MSNNEKTTEHTYTDTLNAVLHYAVHNGDRFRQWVYPRLPSNYTLNPMLGVEIQRLISDGKDIEEIVNSLYHDHS